MIALRRAMPDDVSAIAALVREAYSPWIAVMGREPGPMGFDYAKAIDWSRIDLHHIDDALVALIQMKAADDHLDIINVAVAPSAQGKGLGRAMMAHAEGVAREQGLGELRLFTNKLMVSNQKLYARLGYVSHGEEAFRGGTVAHMRKRIG